VQQYSAIFTLKETTIQHQPATVLLEPGTRPASNSSFKLGAAPICNSLTKTWYSTVQ
jgi:hypothetical protein